MLPEHYFNIAVTPHNKLQLISTRLLVRFNSYIKLLSYYNNIIIYRNSLLQILCVILYVSDHLECSPFLSSVTTFFVLRRTSFTPTTLVYKSILKMYKYSIMMLLFVPSSSSLEINSRRLGFFLNSVERIVDSIHE